MPPRSPAGQPAGQPGSPGEWFASAAGRALLDSEGDSIRRVLAERPGQPWLWLSPVARPPDGSAPGLHLHPAGGGWQGPIRCAMPLPLPNESMATIVIQHTVRASRQGSAELVSECARVLVPGGRLWLYALNPLSPYRWRWHGHGLAASEPMPWRRRLRAAGLQPDPVSEGIGPQWRVEVKPELQPGLGLRAAWLLRAEKRSIPLTPVRNRAALRIGEGVPAA